jgi:hypothetical protein
MRPDVQTRRSYLQLPSEPPLHDSVWTGRSASAVAVTLPYVFPMHVSVALPVSQFWACGLTITEEEVCGAITLTLMELHLPYHTAISQYHSTVPVLHL